MKNLVLSFVFNLRRYVAGSCTHVNFAGDNVRNENVTWPNTPPNGTYTVRVNYWDECGAVATNWVVTVRRKNQAPLTFSGQFTGVGTGGGLGAGQVVTSFNY